MLTPDQSRAARGLLDLRLEDLAARSGISVTTISNFESGSSRTLPANVRVMRLALEEAGAVLIAEDDKAGPGVRLQRGVRP
jgi:transcriptional regulator with XRE-family HTH domain